MEEKALQTGERINYSGHTCQWELTVDTRMMDVNRVLRPEWTLGLNQQAGEYLFIALGLPSEKLEKAGIAMVYTRIRLVFARPVMVDEKICAETKMSFKRGPIMRRNFDISSPDGEYLGGAYTEGVAMDVSTRSILSSEKSKIFEIVPCEDTGRGTVIPRIKLPDNMEEVGCFEVNYADIDFNRHMNNTKYINFVLNYVDGGMIGRYLSEAVMEYHAEIRYGEKVKVMRGGSEKEQVITFVNSENTECFRAKVTVKDIEE